MPRIIETDNLDAEELRIYACTSEVQLLRYFEPSPGLFIAESARVAERALDAGYEPVSLLAEKNLIGEAVEKMRGQENPRFSASIRDGFTSETAGTKQTRSDFDVIAEAEPEQNGGEIASLVSRILERCGDIPVYVADAAVLVRITGYHLTQGFLCAMRRRKLPDVEVVCAGATRIAVLEDVVNPTNVGAIFRSAAALGFDAVLLTRACCDPLYRRAIRVSMGTVFQIPWTYLAAPAPEYVQDLKRMGFATAAMALREDTVSVDDPRLAAEERLTVILGTEGDGLRAETMETCDYTVKIPMEHGVDSLNVAAASAVAFWEMRKRGRAAEM